jgi:hypothetical protein
MAARVLSSESAEADDVATAVLLDIGALVGVQRSRAGAVGRSAAGPTASVSPKSCGPQRLKASSLIEPTFDTLEHGHQ